MREPQKGDKIIQRVSNSGWTVASVVSTQYETTVKMKSNSTTRTVTKKLHNMNEYKYIDTNEWVIPRVRSNGWSDQDHAYMCKYYDTHGIERIANRLGRTYNSVVSQMSRLRQSGLVDKYASM